MGRIIGITFLLLIAAFSVFGFIAAFEPLDNAPRTQWQAIYAGIIVLCLVGIALFVRQGKKT